MKFAFISNAVPAPFDGSSLGKECSGSRVARPANTPRAPTSDFRIRASDQPLVQFHGLKKQYGPVTALAGVDLALRRGAVLALLGPNGAGKSTLFGCLLGLVRPTAGKIDFDGHPLCDKHRLGVGYVAERVALYPQRTVRENGLFFARLRGQPADEFEAQLRRVGLHTVHDRAVRNLSKGMLQRLALAIALCGQPELLVLDEPFNGLDPALLQDLQEILREENRRGATLLIATHTISAVEPLATDVAVLLNGQLALGDTVEQLRAEFPGQTLEGIYHQVARRHRASFGTEVAS